MEVVCQYTKMYNIVTILKHSSTKPIHTQARKLIPQNINYSNELDSMVRII